MATKAKRKYKKQDAKSMIASLDPNVCVFCKMQEDNEDFLGKLIRKCNLTVHYFCMLFSSGLGQGGKTEDDGVLGFLPQDILKEVNRGRRLRCYYCKKKGATVGCVVGSCRRVFHFNCGRKSGTLHQFYDSYRSYCEEHRPRQNNPVSDRLSFYGTANTLCAICMMSVEARSSNETLRAPCCRNSWFHRSCIQRHSTAAGLYFFKCPLCNNKEMFQAEMLKFGIYLPDQDAAWEREPNAFNELLERYTHCDALLCKCLHGRDYNKDGGKWEIIVCDWCGSKGTHVGCHSLHKIGSNDVCADCKLIDEKSRKETGLPKRKKGMANKYSRSPKKTNDENALDANKAKSEYPGQSGVLRKSTPPLKKKFSAKKKPVSPGTVLRLSYEETDDNVVVDGDYSDEDMTLSELSKELAKNNDGGHIDRKRKKTFKYRRCAKKLRSSRSDHLNDGSLDESESDTSFKSGNGNPRITLHRRVASVVSATVTQETEESHEISNTVGTVKNLSLKLPSEMQLTEEARKIRRLKQWKRKHDPFSCTKRKKSKARKPKNSLNDSVSSFASQESICSSVMTQTTDDSQFGDSESNAVSENEMDSFLSQHKYRKNMSLLAQSKNMYPSVSTPKCSGSIERKLSLRSSPTKQSDIKSLTMNMLSPVKNEDDDNSSADSSSNEKTNSFGSNFSQKSPKSSESSNEGNKSIKKLILDQVGKEKKGKSRGKYNKLKKDSNQMSIKLWLQGSSKENAEYKSRPYVSDVKSSLDKNLVNKQEARSFPGEQRKTLVIKFKGKRFVRRIIKDNNTIRKTLEIDGKSPEKVRVKPLTGEKVHLSDPVKSTSPVKIRVKPKVSIQQDIACKSTTNVQLRSTKKNVQKESLEKNGYKTTDQTKSDSSSSFTRKKNETSTDLNSSPSPNKGYPTRKAVSDQKKSISSLIKFPDEMLYTSPKKSKNNVSANLEEIYSDSPKKIEIKSDSDTSSIISITDSSTMAKDMNNSVVILDANDNICHITTSEQEQDKTRWRPRNGESNEDVIILHDNSLNRSKTNNLNSAELSPIGDTYRCLIVDLGGKDFTDSDLQSAQYVNISLEQDHEKGSAKINDAGNLLDKSGANSSETVSSMSSCLLKAFDDNGFQHLNVVVSDAS